MVQFDVSPAMVASALYALVGLTACLSADEGFDKTCIPGQAAPCACTDGRAGAQSCMEDGTFAACVCEGPVPSGAADSGASRPPPAGGGSGGGQPVGGAEGGGAGGSGSGGGSGMPDVAPGAELLHEPCHRIYGVPPDEVLDDDVMLLGTLLPSTGALDEFGPPMERATYLALDEINRAGGCGGKRFALLSCDTGTSVETALAGARMIVEATTAPAILGAASSAVTIEVFNQVARPNGTVVISPSATSPALTYLPDDGLLWRTVPSDATQGAAIAAYLLAQGFGKIAIVNRDDTYGNGLRDAISDAYCAEIDCLVGDNFLTRTYREDTQASDHADAVIELEAFAPDVIVLIAFLEDAIAFLNLAGERGFERFVLTDGAKDDRLLQAVHSDAVLAGAIGTNPAAPPGPAYREFEVRYETAWGEPPNIFNAEAYDAFYLLALSVCAHRGDGPVTGAGVATALRRLVSGQRVRAGVADWSNGVATLRSGPATTIDFDGVSGPLDFDVDTGEAVSSVEVWRPNRATGNLESGGIIYDAAGNYTPPGDFE